MQISPDDSLLATSSMDMRIRIWNPDTLELVRELRSHNDTVNTVHFSMDGRFLASGGMDSQIKIYDIRDDYKEVFHKPGAGWTTVYAVRFAPDSRTLAATCD